jgi:hypothetical protein
VPESQPPAPPFPCPRCSKPLDLPDLGGERMVTYTEICSTCTACEDQRWHAGWPEILPDEWPVDPDELGREYALLIRMWRDVSSP